MELPTPYHIGGHYYVDDVSVGRLPDDETVRDCAGCRGYVYDDRWHVVARVRDTAAGRRQTHHYCSDDCLTAWLRLVTS
ncbi:hypothetical protein EGH21_02670 [Halomicroarcula sp. F13]|uniref:TRASH domain-containing protein n=1 Tax=Haloarcula rubra TaxID=2487747 RepID=A0AAW4PNW5_9EURY|nr:hypothetical protein [Halomicroarcula rubra]MBX0321929.1 hypothetical protein [Halomicroarcula rubra]